MESYVPSYICAILALCIALSFIFTFKVLAAARKMVVVATTPLRPAVGEIVDAVQARGLADGVSSLVPRKGRASTVIFLSSRCPKCRQKLVEIDRMLQPASHSGLHLWLVSVESHRRLVRFFRGTSLESICLRTSLTDYKSLNPTLSTPHYLFIDSGGVLVARGDIGDENWLGLLEQIEPMPSSGRSVSGEHSA